MGNVQGVIYDINFASVTGGVIATGFDSIVFCAYTPYTSDDHGILYKNSASASATEDDFGSFYIDGVTSSDKGMAFCLVR